MESFRCQIDWKCRFSGTRTGLFLLTLFCISPLGNTSNTSLKHWWHLEVHEQGSNVSHNFHLLLLCAVAAAFIKLQHLSLFQFALRLLFFEIQSALQTRAQPHGVSEVYCNKHASCLEVVLCVYGKKKKKSYVLCKITTSVYYLSQSRTLLFYLQRNKSQGKSQNIVKLSDCAQMTGPRQW